MNNTMTPALMFYLIPPSEPVEAAAPADDAENAAENAANPAPPALAPLPIPVGATMPIYSTDYAGWQTELGLVPDMEQAYTISSSGSALVSPLPPKSPTVPIAHFFELFTVEEEQEARALAATNATLEIFFRRLALASTVNLDAYKEAIAQVVDMLACIATEQKAE
ncbi:MAG: hypothetical protein HYZ45_09785, partial [Burkholderiales bacterium]|nr:hypothetical protein [Burkholderiales bacterium]